MIIPSLSMISKGNSLWKR